jgi:hypothetical protein
MGNPRFGGHKETTKKNNDQNVNKKQAKTHTRENIAPSSIYKGNGTDMFEQEDVL